MTGCTDYLEAQKACYYMSIGQPLATSALGKLCALLQATKPENAARYALSNGAACKQWLCWSGQGQGRFHVPLPVPLPLRRPRRLRLHTPPRSCAKAFGSSAAVCTLRLVLGHWRPSAPSWTWRPTAKLAAWRSCSTLPTMLGTQPWRWPAGMGEG